MILDEHVDAASGFVQLIEVDLDGDRIRWVLGGQVVEDRALTDDERSRYERRADRETPRAALVAQLEQATTVAEVRAAVLAAIDGGLL